MGKRNTVNRNTGKRRQGKRKDVKIIVSPVYVGNREMKEIIGNAVVDRFRCTLDKAG